MRARVWVGILLAGSMIMPITGAFTTGPRSSEQGKCVVVNPSSSPPAGMYDCNESRASISGEGTCIVMMLSVDDPLSVYPCPP